MKLSCLGLALSLATLLYAQSLPTTGTETVTSTSTTVTDTRADSPTFGKQFDVGRPRKMTDFVDTTCDPSKSAYVQLWESHWESQLKRPVTRSEHTHLVFLVSDLYDFQPETRTEIERQMVTADSLRSTLESCRSVSVWATNWYQDKRSEESKKHEALVDDYNDLVRRQNNLLDTAMSVKRMFDEDERYIRELEKIDGLAVKTRGSWPTEFLSEPKRRQITCSTTSMNFGPGSWLQTAETNCAEQ